MFIIREEIPADINAREALLDTCFGSNRFAKASERLREGRVPAKGLALSAMAGDRLVATVRLWHVDAGTNNINIPCRALLLGPLAVDPEYQSVGLGSIMMRTAIDTATALGHRAILLVGDAQYYTRFGFNADKTSALWLPGPFERERFLSLELVVGILDGVQGLVTATGEYASAPLSSPGFSPNLPQAA